jgi:hypothetical protein
VSRDSILQVVVRTMNLLESEYGIADLREFGVTTVVEIADEIYADPTLSEGRGGMVAPNESPRQARDRINGFRKD